MNNNSWQQLPPAPATELAVADLDGDAAHQNRDAADQNGDAGSMSLEELARWFIIVDYIQNYIQKSYGAGTGGATPGYVCRELCDTTYPLPRYRFSNSGCKSRCDVTY
jgi:hypothetical protein